MSAIYTRAYVREAVARELLQRPGDTDAAIASVAQALGLPVEAVRDVVATAGSTS